MVRQGVRAPASLHAMPVDFTRFAAVLRDLDVPGQVRELPESAPTAAAAAAQLGCELGAIANSLVFSADDSLASLDVRPVLDAVLAMLHA